MGEAGIGSSADRPILAAKNRRRTHCAELYLSDLDARDHGSYSHCSLLIHCKSDVSFSIFAPSFSLRWEDEIDRQG
jgi:hypothetical protein